MAKLKASPRKLGGWLFRKLPWYGKILVPVCVLASGIYVFEWLVGLFL